MTGNLRTKWKTFIDARQSFNESIDREEMLRRKTMKTYKDDVHQNDRFLNSKIPIQYCVKCAPRDSH